MILRIYKNQLITRISQTILVYLLINSPFWLMNGSSIQNNMVFNLDLLIPLFVSVFSPMLAIFVLVTVWIIQWATLNYYIYYFKSPLEFLYSAKYLTTLELSNYLTLTSVGVIFIFIFSTFFLYKYGSKLHKFSKQISFIVINICILLLVIDFINSSFTYRFNVNKNIAGSPIKVFMAYVNEDYLSLQKLTSDYSTIQQERIKTWAQENPNRSIVYIIVESLGAHIDENVNKYRASQLYSQITDNYYIEEFRVPFSGSTTYAELRDLCGLTGSYKELNNTNARDCLPNNLKSVGWDTHGIHGFSSLMFSRSQWWPVIGIEEMFFAEEIPIDKYSYCGGTFSGVCDEEVIDMAFKIAEEPKKFVYVLTLNSHLPLVKKDFSATDQDFCRNSSLNFKDCLLNQLINKTLISINKNIISQESLKPLIIITGDHAPQFSNNDLRKNYSKLEVPGYILTPLK